MNDDQGLLAEEPLLFPFILALALWSAVWKGFALYRAGSLKSVPWFVVLFILNTAGILEILYLFVFSKKKHTEEAAS
jgi:methionyl-tRNA synthetase